MCVCVCVCSLTIVMCHSITYPITTPNTLPLTIHHSLHHLLTHHSVCGGRVFLVKFTREVRKVVRPFTRHHSLHHHSCLLMYRLMFPQISRAFSHVCHLTGLAHFLEHMLFMGTTKYPGEDAYSKFLADHGGSSNAYTASENTNYYFDVEQSALYVSCVEQSSTFMSSRLCM